MSNINDATEQDFLECTAKSFDALADNFHDIRKLIEDEQYKIAAEKCTASVVGSTQCANVVRERAEDN